MADLPRHDDQFDALAQAAIEGRATDIVPRAPCPSCDGTGSLEGPLGGAFSCRYCHGSGMATAEAIREHAEVLRVLSYGDFILECGKLEDHRREIARADALDRVASELDRLAGKLPSVARRDAPKRAGPPL